MNELINTLGNNFELVAVALVVGAFMVSVIMKALTSMFTTAARERSRREIAAYIAEGSITPEQGERLIRADVNSDRKKVYSA